MPPTQPKKKAKDIMATLDAEIARADKVVSFVEVTHSLNQSNRFADHDSVRAT